MNLDSNQKVNWKKMTFVFGFLVIIVSIFLTLGYQNPINPQPDSSDNYFCSKIKGTPAWEQGGEIIGYGYGFPEKHSKQSFEDEVNDYLIPNNITFIYDPKCIHCKKQIESFGEHWQEYLDSELVIECNILG